tara:strand:- start:45 stop:659 length:615 start_codon:yes stop_codon:yes gene_type:complete
MGSNSGSGGASGSDAGFANTQKSKLSKKNQDLVDASFKDRGAVKIDQNKVLPPTLAIMKEPLKAGSKVTREFFTDKVLGSKNYKDISKEQFEAMTMSQQEQIYGDYSKGRTSGKTDAYGNPIRSGDNGGGNQVVQSTKTVSATAPTAAEVSQSSAADAAPVEGESLYTKKRKTKAVGRSQTILTSSAGASDSYTLGKKSLLGRA